MSPHLILSEDEDAYHQVADIPSYECISLASHKRRRQGSMAMARLLSSRFNNPSSFIEFFVKRPALLIVVGAIKATQDSKRSIVVKETAPPLRLRTVKGGKLKKKRRNGEKKATRCGDVGDCQAGRSS